MPEHYTPTAEHLARLGYAPDSAHDVPTAHLVGYSRQVPAPVAPYFATLVVQVRLQDKLPPDFGPARGPWLLRLPGRLDGQPWLGHPVPTPLFFEQLLQALGWPVGPPLPEVPEASAELMLLRWIAYHPAEAYRLQQRIDEQSSVLDYLGERDLIKVTDPEPYPVPPHPGAVRGQRGRPGLIEPTARGIDYLHQRRGHRETPENLPPVVRALPITKPTK